jgi:hypothetical protein
MLSEQENAEEWYRFVRHKHLAAHRSAAISLLHVGPFCHFCFCIQLSAVMGLDDGFSAISSRQILLRPEVGRL